ncbi:MAG: ribosome recycling factor [Deltaproteobacteria bacterium]|nr:ribosome recycling factor [Deltaproteobacteria bacterium]
MIDEVLEEFQLRIDETVDALKRELSRMRTGRANLSMLDGIRVDYYGQSTALNGLATLAVPDARLITIKPWDRSQLKLIEKAIQESDLGINPQNDGELIRLPIPALTEERRKDMVKQVKHKGEEHKVTVRNARRDAKDMIEALQKDGEVSEDDSKRALEKIQKITDAGTTRIDEIVKHKDEELLTV